MPKWLADWLRQPSTLRVLNIGLGLIGYALAPEQLENILMFVGSVWILIDGFYNRQPPKP